MRKIEEVGAAVIVEITSLVGVAAWDKLAPDTRARVKESLGRAAIEAMREPAGNMIRAGAEIRTGTVIVGAYQAMIDAALEEGKDDEI